VRFTIRYENETKRASSWMRKDATCDGTDVKCWLRILW